MIIKNLMSQELLTLELDDDLNKAKAIFDENNIHHILIIDEEGVLSGVINDRDMYKYLSPNIGTSKETYKDTSLLQKKMHLIMARDVITAKKEQSLHEAVLLFHDNHISCLPIVDEDDKPVGIITWRDIIKVIALQYRQKLKTSNLT